MDGTWLALAGAAALTLARQRLGSANQAALRAQMRRHMMQMWRDLRDTWEQEPEGPATWDDVIEAVYANVRDEGPARYFWTGPLSELSTAEALVVLDQAAEPRPVQPPG
jgi:hypothetical protein